LKDLQKLGQDFRKEYENNQKLLSYKYDPSSLYLHADQSTSSMISAYAFILGAYPDNVSYLDTNDSSGGSNLLSAEQLVRTKLGLSKVPSGTQNTKVPVSSDEGYLYWRQPTKHCPIIYDKNQLIASVKPNSGSTSADRLRRASNKIQVESANTVQKLLEDYPGFNHQNLVDQYENAEHLSYNVGGSRSDEVNADDVKHTHFFIDQTSFVAFLKSLGYGQASSAKTADNVRFEIFETGGKYYVRTTMGDKAVNFEGSQNGVFDLNTFLQLVYARLYLTGVQDICVGKEDTDKSIYPQCQRGNYVTAVTRVETVSHPEVVEKCHIKERVVPTERCSIAAEHRVAVPVIEEVRIVEPVHVVEHYAVPQVVYDTKVVEKRVAVEVPVPVIEEKVVVREVETLVAEAPTHIHHIEIEKVDEPSLLPPVQFHEEIDGGWPWWLWLLPLLC
jgi:hypothetical protein